MPPKPKYTKEEIVAAALEIVARDGAPALTAKALAHSLRTSTTPIFTVFNSMQEVQDAVQAAAMARFESYAHKADPSLPPFKQVGMQMISFAKEEPRLYQLLFMSTSSGVTSFDDIYDRLGAVATESLAAISRDYGLSEVHARLLFEHAWIHTYGIGVLCATGMCNFSQSEISQMLTQDFTAMMLLLKSEGIS